MAPGSYLCLLVLVSSPKLCLLALAFSLWLPTLDVNLYLLTSAFNFVSTDPGLQCAFADPVLKFVFAGRDSLE